MNLIECLRQSTMGYDLLRLKGSSERGMNQAEQEQVESIGGEK